MGSEEHTEEARGCKDTYTRFVDTIGRGYSGGRILLYGGFYGLSLVSQVAPLFPGELDLPRLRDDQ